MKLSTEKKLFGDQDVELIIGNLLRYGVITSIVIAFIGGALYLYQHGLEKMPDYTVFKGEDPKYTSLPAILKGLRSLSAGEIIQFGVVVLIATPILRIALSLVAFAIEKDRLYVVITLIVLLIMLGSMFGGLKG
jgi:uncharacterized membrane protein